MKYAELFCGCGGSALGARAAQWECICAIDNDAFALALYNANFPSHETRAYDLSQKLPDDLYESLKHNLQDGVLIAGAPCQDFSRCGLGKESRGHRAALTQILAEHVKEICPKWFVFENVAQAAKSPQFAVLTNVLTELGYSFHHNTCCTLDVGMAQKRHRLILIAHRDGSPEMVSRAWHMILASPRQGTTMRQVFERNELAITGNHVYYPKPRAPDSQASVFPLDGHSPTIRGRTRPMPQNYKFTRNDSSQDRDDIFAMSSAHIAALQGFPNDFKWPSRSVTRTNQCIGNAIPPPLMSIVSLAIDRAHNSLSTHAPRVVRS